MGRWLLLVAASATLSSSGVAQDVRSDAVACRDSAVAGLYRRCALWLEGNKVRRGEEGIIVGKPGFFRPTAMSRLVAGDSALRYAGIFERRATLANRFLIASTVLVTAGYIAIANGCQSNSFGGCGHDDWVAPAIAIGGTALMIPGVILQVRAQGAAARAVWWNNERFSR